MTNTLDLAYNITLFQFGCPLCGAGCRPRKLRQYLDDWSVSSSGRFLRLLSAFSGVVNEVRGVDWMNEEAELGLATLDDLLDRVRVDMPFDKMDQVTVKKGRTTSGLLIDCPICGVPAGRRLSTDHWDPWPEANRAQLGDFLWDANLIFWSLSMLFPNWLTGSAAENLRLIRNGSKYTILKANMMECPQCGRFAAMLYGNQGTDQFCNHCLNDGMPYMKNGSFGMGFSVSLKPTGPEIEMLNPEPKKPAEQDRDLLPPEEDIF